MTTRPTQLTEDTHGEFFDWATKFGYPVWTQLDGLSAIQNADKMPAATDANGLPDGWTWRAALVDDMFAATTPGGWVFLQETTFTLDGQQIRSLRLTEAHPTLGGLVEFIYDTPTGNRQSRNQAVGALLALFLTAEEFPAAEQMLAALGGQAPIPLGAYDPALHQRFPPTAVGTGQRGYTTTASRHL